MQSVKASPSEASTAKTQISASPFIAILGVLLCTLTSVFTGRLLSIGSADLQGAIGADSDAMNWLSTAFNASAMFIGPMTVFLGGLFGPRRVILWASAVFMLCEFISPFVAHNIAALIVVQIIAGITSGTYYPLALSVIVQNLPLKYVHLGIAVYALDILASTHIATLLEAWYMNHLSWQWIFWNALFLTPVLMVCVYFGIPPKPPSTTPAPKMSLRGFFYASTAFTLLYIALDQGERLGWFNSGIVAAYFITGLFLLSVSVVRHTRQPFPLLNLRFLRARNLLLLGAVLICFRFLLLAPTLLLPKFLGLIHNYRPDQTGQVLGWIAVPELIAAPLAGLLLYRADSRLLCAIGFLLVACTSLVSSRIDPSWTGETFVVTQIINAIGLALALTGLVATIMRNALAMGALKNPANILTLACWFQICRLFGAELGKTAMVRFLTVQGELHYLTLSQHVDGGWLTEERLLDLIGATFSNGSGLDDAKSAALTALGAVLKQQIGLLAISDGFVLIALVAFGCLLMMGFIKYAPPLVAPQR